MRIVFVQTGQTGNRWYTPSALSLKALSYMTGRLAGDGWLFANYSSLASPPLKDYAATHLVSLGAV